MAVADCNLGVGIIVFGNGGLGGHHTWETESPRVFPQKGAGRQCDVFTFLTLILTGELIILTRAI